MWYDRIGRFRVIYFRSSQGARVSATTPYGYQYIAVVQQRCRMALSRSHATRVGEGAGDIVVQLSVQCATDVVHGDVPIWKFDILPSAASCDQHLTIGEQCDCVIRSRRKHVARRSE